jgi:acetolactate synthase regulatory subunit
VIAASTQWPIGNHGLMPEFSSDAERAEMELTVDHDAAPDSGSKGDTEHDLCVLSRSDGPFRERERTRIVDHGNVHFEATTDSVSQAVASPRTREIGEQFDDSRCNVEQAGYAKAHSCDPGELAHRFMACGDKTISDSLRTAYCVRWNPCAMDEFRAISIVRLLEHRSFDVCSSEVESEVSGRSHSVVSESCGKRTTEKL